MVPSPGNNWIEPDPVLLVVKLPLIEKSNPRVVLIDWPGQFQEKFANDCPIPVGFVVVVPVIRQVEFEFHVEVGTTPPF